MKVKKNSNKSFGILFFVVFFLIGIWPIFSDGNLRLWSLIVSVLFLVLGLLNSRILTPLSIIWIKFGELLGKIIAPIVMALVFFLTITPLGFLMRLLGKDLLNLKFSKNSSYWIKREKNIGSMKRQF
tara:strand:+ start:96 stop:476 length:381 start_codon:yes stop_codon:yes gene_type:complete